MKRIAQFILTVVLFIFLSACNNSINNIPSESSNYFTGNVDAYYLNDFHGAILEDTPLGYLGFPKIGNYLLSQKESDHNIKITLAGGDMLQGEFLSNISNGESVIDIMNELNFDAFTLGNHEFDWGLEEVTKYFNPDRIGIKATFPLLGANVIEKETNKMPEYVNAYTIIEKNKLKIGIIGLVGEGLENSISGSKIAPYYFGNTLEYAKKYTKELRIKEKVDIVLINIHGANDMFNKGIAQLKGNEYVDAVFNGHTHQEYERLELRENKGQPLPVIQSNNKGKAIGHINFLINNNQVVNISLSNIKNDILLNQNDLRIQDKVNAYQKKYNSAYKGILRAYDNYERAEISHYVSYLMRDYTKADIAIHNDGGTRVKIMKNEELSLAKVYQILPFTNQVVVFNMSGNEIYNNYIIRSDLIYSVISGLNIKDLRGSQKIYKVAVNDYIFQSSKFTFNKVKDNEYYDKTITDLLENSILSQKELGKSTYKLDQTIGYYKVPLLQDNILSIEISNKIRSLYV